MIDRVRSAIYDGIEATAEGDNLALQGGRIYFEGVFDFVTLARRVIEAMREPTPDMSMAAERARDRHSDYTAPDITYRAMIAAALA